MERLINQEFERGALAIGELAAAHDLSNDFVWSLFRTLDATRQGVLESLEGHRSSAGECGEGGDLHPAVAEFITRCSGGHA